MSTFERTLKYHLYDLAKKLVSFRNVTMFRISKTVHKFLVFTVSLEAESYIMRSITGLPMTDDHLNHPHFLVCFAPPFISFNHRCKTCFTFFILVAFLGFNVYFPNVFYFKKCWQSSERQAD